MTDFQKEYIEKNIDLIEQGRFEEFFDIIRCPNGVGSILYEAGIDFLSKLKRVPQNSFRDGTISSIIIPSNIKEIRVKAFRDCKNLTNIELPEGLILICADSFFGCSKLTTINIPRSVTTVSSYAFAYCHDLTDITIPSGVETIPRHTFEGCRGLKNVIIENGVKYIGDMAFYNCPKLEHLVLPETIEIVEDNAFAEGSSNLVIDFAGTKDAWRQIYNTKAFRNTYFKVNCSDGVIKKSKK